MMTMNKYQIFPLTFKPLAKIIPENIIKTNSAKTSELWDPNFATKKVENDRYC